MSTGASQRAICPSNRCTRAKLGELPIIRTVTAVSSLATIASPARRAARKQPSSKPYIPPSRSRSSARLSVVEKGIDHAKHPLMECSNPFYKNFRSLRLTSMQKRIAAELAIEVLIQPPCPRLSEKPSHQDRKEPT